MLALQVYQFGLMAHVYTLYESREQLEQGETQETSVRSHLSNAFGRFPMRVSYTALIGTHQDSWHVGQMRPLSIYNKSFS